MSGAGQQRYDETGQGTAGDNLEHDVGHRVDGLIGVAQAGRTHGPAEDDDPTETCQPGHYGEHGDQQGGPSDRAYQQTAS